MQYSHFKYLSLGKVNRGLVIVKETVTIQTGYPCLNKKWNMHSRSEII